MERITIFIDGSNFYHGLKANNCSAKIDFYKLSKLLTGKQRKLIRTYYYNAAYNQTDDPLGYANQLKYFARVKKTPYLTVKLGRLEKRTTKEQVIYYIEKGVDIAIAVDMLKFAYSDSYDTAILISGDGDFVSALEEIQNLGKHVENAYFQGGLSIYLRESCDRFILLTTGLINKCLHAN